MKRLYVFASRLSERSLKAFMMKRLPVYLLLLLVLILYGVKGLMITLMFFVSFFLGWTVKGLFQAFKDWRLTQRLNRVYFSQVEYDSLHRENKMLHEALNAFRDSAKRGGGAAAPMPQAAAPQRARYDQQQIQEMILQMNGEANG